MAPSRSGSTPKSEFLISHNPISCPTQAEVNHNLFMLCQDVNVIPSVITLVLNALGHYDTMPVTHLYIDIIISIWCTLIIIFTSHVVLAGDGRGDGGRVGIVGYVYRYCVYSTCWCIFSIILTYILSYYQGDRGDGERGMLGYVVQLYDISPKCYEVEVK